MRRAKRQRAPQDVKAGRLRGTRLGVLRGSRFSAYSGVTDGLVDAARPWVETGLARLGRGELRLYKSANRARVPRFASVLWTQSCRRLLQSVFAVPAVPATCAAAKTMPRKQGRSAVGFRRSHGLCALLPAFRTGLGPLLNPGRQGEPRLYKMSVTATPGTMPASSACCRGSSTPCTCVPRTTPAPTPSGCAHRRRR